MTVTEVARRLGVEYDYVLRLIRMGRLRARKQGRVWVVDERSVEQRVGSLSKEKEN
jgi:excisionase family DNA binding protein